MMLFDTSNITLKMSILNFLILFKSSMTFHIHSPEDKFSNNTHLMFLQASVQELFAKLYVIFQVKMFR